MATPSSSFGPRRSDLLLSPHPPPLKAPCSFTFGVVSATVADVDPQISDVAGSSSPARRLGQSAGHPLHTSCRRLRLRRLRPRARRLGTGYHLPCSRSIQCTASSRTRRTPSPLPLAASCVMSCCPFPVLVPCHVAIVVIICIQSQFECVRRCVKSERAKAQTFRSLGVHLASSHLPMRAIPKALRPELPTIRRIVRMSTQLLNTCY
jgi:hypothetical protein